MKLYYFWSTLSKYLGDFIPKLRHT